MASYLPCALCNQRMITNLQTIFLFQVKLRRGQARSYAIGRKKKNKRFLTKIIHHLHSHQILHISTFAVEFTKPWTYPAIYPHVVSHITWWYMRSWATHVHKSVFYYQKRLLVILEVISNICPTRYKIWQVLYLVKYAQMGPIINFDRKWTWTTLNIH